MVTQIRSRLSSSAVKLQAQVARLEEVNNAIKQCNAERIGTRQRLEREKLLLEETKRDHQRERQRYFAQLFPKISEVANYVLVTLDSGAGCLVCGNKEPDAASRVHALTAEGICPVCETPPERQGVIVPAGRVAEERLDKIAIRLQEQFNNVRALTAQSL
jgi:CRISPR/Cas system-associated protein Cas10 (large subunit of type III CRISPR-Cas system)